MQIGEAKRRYVVEPLDLPVPRPAAPETALDERGEEAPEPAVPSGAWPR